MTGPTQTVSTAGAGEFGLTWPHRLFPYQASGVRALINTPSLLLADEMGLGKTIQAIAALRCLFAADAARVVLVVAPPAYSCNGGANFDSGRRSSVCSP